jgi:hypothetical protein
MPDLDDDGWEALTQVVSNAWFGNGEVRRSSDYRRTQEAFAHLINLTRGGVLSASKELHAALIKGRQDFLSGGPTRPNTPAWAAGAILIWTTGGGILNEVGIYAGISANSPAIRFTANVLVRSGYSGANCRNVSDFLKRQGAKSWLNTTQAQLR